LAGATAAFSLLAAERHRRVTGLGQEVRVPLGDVAMATLGHLGQIAEVTAADADRPRMGNELYGAFGRDFLTRDGKRMMIVAITPRQWTGLLKALDIAAAVAALEAELGVSFARDEGLRFIHRYRLFPLIEAAVARTSLAELGPRLDANDVCWGPYRTLHEALRDDPRISAANPMFAAVAHPSGVSYPTPGSAASFMGAPRSDARPAPRLGEHTDEVLAAVLALPEHEIGRLHDAGLVAGAKS
jgi:2-methylfumaryl-CoA isomerase